MAVALEIAFVQVLAGTAVLVTLAFVIGKTFGYPLRDLPLLTIASNVAIAAAGGWLLYRAMTRPQIDLAETHADPRPLPVAVRLLPCPMTMLLLSYAVANRTLLSGLASRA